MPEANEPIRDPAVIEALAGLVEAQQTQTRVTCATSLGHAQVDEARACALLERLVQDAQEPVRIAAARALGRLASHSPLAVPAVLRSALVSSEAPRVLAAVLSLGQGRNRHNTSLALPLAVLAGGGSLLPEPTGKGWKAAPAPASWDLSVASAACDALRFIFPPSLRTPLMRQVLRVHLHRPPSEPREIALADLLEVEPQMAHPPLDLLHLVVATGMPSLQEVRYGEGHGFAETAERKAHALLTRLLATSLPAQSLFEGLAAARRPALRSFVPWLREHLGHAPLEARPLAALLQALAGEDPLVCANAWSLLSCAPGQKALAEPTLVTRLTHVEKTLRTLAAEALRSLEALQPSSLEALTRLARRHPRGTDGRAAREALARHGAPVPLPEEGVDVSTRVVGLLWLPEHSGEEQLLGEDGALYYPWLRQERPLYEEKPSVRALELGLARVRLTSEGPRVEVLPMPWKLQRPAPPDTWERRKLRLVSRLEEGGLLCLLTRRQDSRRTGVSVTHVFLHFQPSTGVWSQALPSAEGLPSRRVALDERLESDSRTVSGRRYLVWRDDQGRLKAFSDSINYDNEDREIDPETAAKYSEMLDSLRAATRHHALEVAHPWSDDEPWVVGAPTQGQGGSFYGVRQALFQHRPDLRAEQIQFLRSRGAHLLPDASGRPHPVLFVEVGLYPEDVRVQQEGRILQALLVLAPD
jgi:hypothetical protein